MRIVHLAAAALLIANACGSSPEAQDTDAASASPRVVWTDKVTLAATKTYASRDGALNIEWRKVHSLNRRSDAAYVVSGLPYLKMGSGWLELVKRAEVVAKQHVYRITVDACAAPSKDQGDTTRAEVESCDLTIEQLDSTLTPRKPQTASMSFKLEDLYSLVIAQADAKDGPVYLRSSGALVDNADPSTGQVGHLEAGLDIITPLGVANLDIDAMPAVGYEQTVEIGSERIVLKVRDAYNRVCDPACHDLLDIELRLEALSQSEQMPVVLDYE